MKMYGLLHLQENEKTAMNLSNDNFQQLISIYINNAITLANSLRTKGISFTLLTNRKDIINGILGQGECDLQVQDIPFITKVPTGIRFYSAHFKLDAFRYLATLNEAYVGLCDLDMVCINDFPQSLNNIIKAETPLFYDISEQVIPAHGANNIIRDLKLIHGLESEGRWSGGEFISGTPDFFNTLIKEIDGVAQNYFSHVNELHHIGDEAITSAALEVMRRKGQYIADAGALGIVGRFWSISILHPQKSFDYFRQCFLLHLPADKKFLSEMAIKRTITSEKLLDLYDKYRNSPIKVLKKAIRSCVNSIKKVFR